MELVPQLFSGIIVSLFLSAVSQTQDLKTSYYSNEFGPFNASYYSNFAVQSPAAISNGALQLTPDSAGNFDLKHRSGRVLLNHSFKMWEDEEDGGRLASFNSFVFNIFRVDNSSVIGEGLAFFIAPDLNLPENSDGQYLGLTNSSTEGNSSNQIVAIEVDTFKEVFDPDDNHIGLDIHSIVSNKTASLSNFDIQIAPVGIKFFKVWVDYDGLNKLMEVYMEEDGKAKPTTPVLYCNLDLRGLVNQYSYFGFAASTGRALQLNYVHRWNLTVKLLPNTIRNSNSDKLIKIVLPIVVPVVFLLLLTGVGCLIYYMRKKRAILLNFKEFRFKDLKKATNDFDDKRKIGEGSVSVVYRGVLQNESLEAAVKLFSTHLTISRECLLSELRIIGRLRHKHVLPLLGWCLKNGRLLLVYEFMPNGSLDKQLFHGSETLGWTLRYNIISGVASALNYLHNEQDFRVVHGDVKPGNIMLDSNFTPYLGDFGLARLLSDDSNSSPDELGIRGTCGYIAPENFHTGRSSCKSDVYGFGVVVLELVCGQHNRHAVSGFPTLADWVWWLHRGRRILEAVDKKLHNDYVAEEAERLLLLGMSCCNPNPNMRPEAQAISQMISGSRAVPHVPYFKPAFMWPPLPEDLEAKENNDLNSTISLEITTSE
ncbi:hypothetical protein K2173_009579 [Erythroxylum novogranatense]|uniref:Protein kinase domain-containing protein n=1 Tax=Erythroxylum novogranatense TaxID=1862640 RepID=A0AAV8U4J4_9ROSI|nr:hypothetical protein K2173_009579 [Erythroxylum novogranatense]